MRVVWGFQFNVVVLLAQEFLQCHGAESGRVQHATSRKRDYLLGNQPSGRVIYHLQVQYLAHAFQRRRHRPDCLGVECLLA
jgi:hypothetical protein